MAEWAARRAATLGASLVVPCPRTTSVSPHGASMSSLARRPVTHTPHTDACPVRVPRPVDP
eukprot:7099951-Prymnesium_polylepis.1